MLSFPINQTWIYMHSTVQIYIQDQWSATADKIFKNYYHYKLYGPACIFAVRILAGNIVYNCLTLDFFFSLMDIRFFSWWKLLVNPSYIQFLNPFLFSQEMQHGPASWCINAFANEFPEHANDILFWIISKMVTSKQAHF